MSQQEEILYEEVFRALNKAKINYVVCGGAAVVFLGINEGRTGSTERFN